MNFSQQETRAKDISSIMANVQIVNVRKFSDLIWIFFLPLPKKVKKKLLIKWQNFFPFADESSLQLNVCHNRRNEISM